MPAEITWNGIAKSYRVGKFNFVQNRMQLIDDDDLIAYLKTTKHFTVIDKAPKKVEKIAAPVEPESDAEGDAEGGDEGGDEGDAEGGDEKPKRGPRSRATRGGK